jgi:hypothetical protein
MDLKTLAGLVTSKTARPLLHIQKHSPAILFGAGVVGVVTTVVLASKATLRLEEVLQDTDDAINKALTLEHHNYSEQDRSRDLLLIKVKAATKVARLYAPTLIVGTLSIAALTGAHVTLTRRNLALTAAYAGLSKAFGEYRARIADAIGVDEENRLRYDLVDTEVQVTDKDGKVTTKTVAVRGPKGYSQYARLFEETNRNWNPQPMYNSFFIQNQQTWANFQLKAKGHLFLNDVYKMLGLPESKAGCVVGWLIGSGGDEYVDFGVFSGDELTGFDFITGEKQQIWLDFNVDGPIWDFI